MRTSICTLLARLRPNAVGIVDALDFSDRELHSVLGKRDGNVYSALLNWAQHSQLNKDDVSRICRSAKCESRMQSAIYVKGFARVSQAHQPNAARWTLKALVIKHFRL